MFKIEQIETGWIVMWKQANWSVFGLEYKWIPFVKTYGMDEVWVHESYEFAEKNLLSVVRENIIKEIWHGNAT